MKEMKRRKFVITCEFELFGDPVQTVVTACPELNIHTVDSSIEGSVDKLAEAIKFFFSLAEGRHQLDAIIGELERGEASAPPWTPPVQ